MKQFTIVVLGLGLALLTACSKEDEVEKPAVINEPTVPMTSQELTGEFSGEWSYMYSTTQIGKIVVNDGYVFVDTLPTSAITRYLVDDIQFAFLNNPDLKDPICDKIGNFYVASSYQFPKTDLQIKYTLDSYTSESFSASISSITNMWSDITTTINIDKAPPYQSETIVIAPPEPNTISFSVEADGVPYRIDLISEEHDITADLNMTTGLWLFQYWFKKVRINNLNTGQQQTLETSLFGPWFNDRDNKEDRSLLQFQATNRTGAAEERIIFH